MTSKAYIVANEQQERELLEKLERDGFTWWGGDNLTENMPSNLWKTKYPYALINDGEISWKFLSQLKDEEIVYDGLKEEKMSDKYVVSQEFMNELNIWKTNLKSYDDINNYFVGTGDLRNLPILANLWASDRHITNKEHNNRLIAIIRWVNGEDVFEVEKPKKWVVRSKDTDSTYCYAQLLSENNNTLFMGFSFANATRFDTKEEAESWANAHQEVVSVEA